jgi:hypothetical protein
MAFELF